MGEIDIDSELVAASQRLDGREEARIMMLNNGCLCCTVRDDLVDMLTELVSALAGWLHSGARAPDALCPASYERCAMRLLHRSSWSRDECIASC